VGPYQRGKQDTDLGDDSNHRKQRNFGLLATAVAADAGAPLLQLAGYWTFSLFSLGILALRAPRCGHLDAAPRAGVGSRRVRWRGQWRSLGPAGTPPGTCSISISASAGAASHSAAVSVTVQ